MTGRNGPRSYADGSADAPLFDLDGTGALGMVVARVDRETQKAPAAVAWAHCPLCTGAGVRSPLLLGVGRDAAPAVPLLAGGVHLLWKAHDIVTNGGTRTPCRASAVALCQLAPRGGVMWRKPRAGEDDEHRVRTAAACRCGVTA